MERNPLRFMCDSSDSFGAFMRSIDTFHCDVKNLVHMYPLVTMFYFYNAFSARA